MDFALIWQKVEVYVIIVGFALCLIGAAYLKGRADVREDIKVEQLKADQKEYQDFVSQGAELRRQENEESAKTLALLTQLTRGISGAESQFKNLVVVDPSGCAVFGSDFRLRWNQVEALSAGAGVGTTPGARDAVPDHSVPVTR